jgi:hypothetical protein
MIVSIQGAEPNCSLANKETAAPQDKAGAETYSTKCNSNPSVRPGSQQYSPVVTVSFPK